MVRRKTVLIGALALSIFGATNNTRVAPPAFAEASQLLVERRYFAPHPQQYFGYDAGILTFAAGDIDGDQDVDIVGVDLYSYPDGEQNGSSIWLNDGMGSFHERIPLAGIDWALNVTLADLDTDTDLDMVVSRADDRAELIGWNDGTGAFTMTDDFNATNTYQTLVFDVDGDTDLDLFGVSKGDTSPAPADAREKIWINDGVGGLTETARFELTENGTIFHGDLDGDTDIDLMVDEYHFTNVFLNDGTGVFTLDHTIPAAEGSVSALGDLDGDGDLDAIGSQWNSQSYTVWYNDGTGEFTSVKTSLNYGAGNWFTLSDFDQDGDLDALMNGGLSEAKQVFINDGSGRFMVQQAFGEGMMSQILLTDVNNDTWTDIITANNPHVSSHNGPSVWINQDFSEVEAMSTLYAPLVLK